MNVFILLEVWSVGVLWSECFGFQQSLLNFE